MTVAPPGPVCWPGPAAPLQTTAGTRAAGSGPQDLTADQDQDTVSSVVIILTINTDLVLPPSLFSLRPETPVFSLPGRTADLTHVEMVGQ